MAHTLDAPAYAAPIAGFRSRKAAQLAALFANFAGGTIEKLKLVKLIYLAERDFLGEYHFPMLFDEFYSLYNGPVCSATLNGIDGVIHGEIWDHYITRHGKDRIVAVKKFAPTAYDELSAAERSMATKIWTEFGHKTAGQLVEYTHKKCPEWVGVKEGRRLPIRYSDILAAFGESNADAIDHQIDQMRRAESALAG